MSRHAQGDIPAGARLDPRRAVSRGLDPLRDRVNAALWLVLGPLAVYAPKGTVVLLALFVLAIPDHRAAARKMGELLRAPFGPVVGAWFVWAAVSLMWTPEPAAAADSLLRLAMLTLAGLLFLSSVIVIPGSRRRRIRRCVALAPVLTVFFLAIEYTTGGALAALFKEPIDDYRIYALRGTAVLAILTIPAAALLLRQGKPWLSGGLIAVAAVAVSLMPMAASAVALAAGLFVAVIVWFAGKRAATAVMATICLLCFAAPWVFTSLVPPERFGRNIVAVPPSWQHRLGIWEFVGARTLHRPVLGHGYDSARVIGEESGTVTVVTPTGSSERKRLPLHPHNVALQVWLELGAVGVALFAAVLLAAAALVARTEGSRMFHPAVFGVAISALVVMALSYGAWQNWWHAAMWIAAAACAMSVTDEEETIGPEPFA